MGVTDRPEDAFFLIRAELDQASSLAAVVGQRRAVWERQRRLLAPLAIGRPPRLVRRQLLAIVEAVRTRGTVAEGAIVGQPASPGRATGPVHIVAGPGDFDRFQPGEVLVARATTPAWTPLFARAAAVVAAGDATTRHRDGQLVTVDGGAGTIRPHD